MQEKGNLSINSENFMPIIKKWLYTDKDIFIRELVSNACDAVTKLQKLSMMGEADIPAEEAYEIHVVLDQDKKTLQIIDNGIGMTADEIKKYINQIAFSGATDFLSKFEGKTEDEGSEIIGHFGLGFYSAFMVADTVEIDSLSYQKGAEPAKWRCNGGIDYEMEAGERTERGTTITLFIGADGEEFLNEATLYAAMRKYCAFMPVPIFVDVLKEETEEEKAAAKKAENTVHVSPEEAAKLTTEGAMDLLQEQQDAAEEAKAEEPKPLNDTNPLWQRKPSECTDEDYKAFYHQVFNDLNDPLFWIHLNMDYPFRLKGILYFPKLVEQMDMMDGEVKLYCNQVYIADNVKEVVPEFLLLLKGILDCPDMPLNVSRSALQNDGYVEKMNAYITKKVADKLNQLFKTDRSAFEGFWDDINIFIKYGCIKDADLFSTLESHSSFEDLKEELPAIITRCVDIKRMVVENDQFDTGERMLLNFGHTLAHTIEQYFHYQRESHGEAVAIGMYQITRIAEEKGLTPEGTADRIQQVLKTYGLPFECGLTLGTLTEAIALDKKNLNGNLNVILLHEIGNSYIEATDIQFFAETARLV